MNNIKNTVSNGVSRLKNVFNFSCSLPRIKLPHFSVSGKFSLNPPSIPSFSESWYRNGAILPNGSNMLFGMNGNSLMAGGEFGTGGEAVLPLNKLWNELHKQFQKQNSMLNNNNNNDNRPLNIILKLNDIELGQATVNSLKALADHKGELDLPL